MRATAFSDVSSYSYYGMGDVTSDSSMNVAQWFDYAPYGSVIATTNTGQTTAGRQFEGLFTDATNLVYSNARYLNPAQGQFTTEDPVFLAVGNPGLMKQVSGQDLQSFLSDPQQMHAYSYGRDNPITLKDPTGNGVFTDALQEIFFASLYGNTTLETGDSIWTYNEDRQNGASSETLYNDQARRDYSIGTFGASSVALFVSSGAAAVVDLGTFDATLIAADKGAYCNLCPCRDFSGGQKTISEILATIPSGPMANPTLMPHANGGPSAPGGSSGNGPVAHVGTTNGGGGNGSGSLSLAQQIASIQAQIQSIQAQLNNYIQSQAKGR
jgi:RHS repeat-associated protein